MLEQRMRVSLPKRMLDESNGKNEFQSENPNPNNAKWKSTDNGGAEKLYDEDGRFAFSDEGFNCIFSKG